MTIEIDRDDPSNPVNRPKQAKSSLQQSATKGNANGQAGSADTSKVTQQAEALTDNPSRPTLTLSHSPADSVVTIAYTIPDSAFKDSVHVGLKVYNMSGMLAALLVDDIQSVGSHTLLLEKRRLSDGVYLSISS